MWRPNLRKIVILATSVVALSYLFYRGIYTLNLTTTYASIASILLYVGEWYGVINMLLYFVQVWVVYEPPQRPVPVGKTVDVFVPTYNEDPDMLRTTLLACVAMDYPHKTYLCDDGGTEARCNDPEKGPPSRERQAKLKDMCEELGVIYMTRPKNEHAKAGNLNHAFERTDGEFLIIFDADHVPEPNFITRLLGYFDDPKLAFVQTPHAFYNFESFQARLSRAGRKYWEEGQLFYHVIQPGRNRWGCPIFAGSAALFRRAALKEVGYIATETITEDMHTGMRMHARGWTSMGIGERMVAGQAAQDVTTFHSQRLRWGEGNISVIFYDNPLTMRGLTLGQRLCYLATVLNWGGGLFKLAIYLTPLMMLFTGVPPVKEFTWGLAAFMGVYMAASILGTKYAGNGYGSFWYSELFTMASFWTQIRGANKALFWRKFQTFIVTSKRGRQSKSIWPYIRPQVYLILFSMLAVTWAWSRLLLGVSDDPFKPMLATFWAFFHMWLAYLIVRRAFWPDDRRFSTRHSVHLPVTFKSMTKTEPKRLGFTGDLNDTGCTLIGYQSMEVGDRIRLSIHSPHGPIECLAEVRSVRMLTPRDKAIAGASGGYRFGVQFHNRTAKQIDSLNLVCLHYAVPRTYRRYAEGHRPLWQSIPLWFVRHLRFRRHNERRDYRLALFMFPVGRPEEARYAITEDVSRTSMAVLLPTAMEPGTQVRYSIATPLGEVSGVGIVLRSTLREVASRPFCMVVVEFDQFDSEGREALTTLFRSEVRRSLGKLLEPKKDPLPVPMNRPLTTGVIIALILTILELGAFRFAYQDDFFLRAVATTQRPLTNEEAEEVDKIYQKTMAQSWPGTDRLVLLTNAMNRMDRPTEVAEITRRLAPRAPNNLELQLALAYAHDQREDFDKADAEFRKALAALDAGRLPESRREGILIGAARAAARSGDVDLAGSYFRQLNERFPEKPIYRNEYAGSLLGARHYPEAVAVLRSGELDVDGRMLLVYTFTASGDLNAAEREARTLIAARPEDAAAQGLLADVLNTRGDFRQAQAIYEKLLKSGGDDLRITIQLANASLWAKNYDDALDRFRAIFARSPDMADVLRRYPQIRKSYVNASASALKLNELDRPAALVLFDETQKEQSNDSVYLARLGWVLQRHGENDKSATLVDQAMTLNPGDDGLRRQLASALVAAGRAEEALRLLQESNPGPEGRLLLADAYLAIKDFVSAEKECRAVLAAEPGNKDARTRLANVLSWKGDHAASLPIFMELVREFPEDVELPVRLAEVSLWNGDYAAALDRYRVLLSVDFNKPWLWYGYIDAAAQAKKLTREQATLAQAIADRTLLDEHKSPRVVAEFRKQNRPLKEAPFLTRLGWVLVEQLKDTERTKSILDRAVASAPTDPAERKELAGVLAAAKRYDEAIAQFEGLELQLDDRLKLARINAAAGRFTPAIALCRNALKLQPLNREVRATLADVLSWDGQFVESLALLNALIEAEPTVLELQRRRAEVLLWSGDMTTALARYEELLAIAGEDDKLWAGFIEAASRAANLTATQLKLAERAMNRSEVASTDSCLQLTNQAGMAARQLKDPVRAKSLLARAIAVRPKDAIVLSRLGWELHQAGETKSAELVLNEAVALAPKDAKSRRELAGVLTAVGRFNDALTLYRELAEQSPSQDLDEQIALVTLWSGNSAKAVEIVENLLKANFKRPKLWRAFVDAAASATMLSPDQLTLVRRIAGEPAPEGTIDEQATFDARLAWILQRSATSPEIVRKLLDRAVALQPQTPKVRFELAGVLMTAGQFADALPWLKELVQAEPANLEFQQRLAEASLGAGKYADAAEQLGKLLVANFEQPRFWGLLIDATAANKDQKPEGEHLALLIRLAEKSPPDIVTDKAAYLTRLAASLQRAGKLELAKPVLQRAIALAPKDPKIRLDLTALMTTAGQFKEARDWLDELAKANPNDLALQGRLAQVMLWSGDRVAALERLTKLLETNIEQEQLWSNYVDAASPLNKGDLTAAQIRIAERIAARPVPMATEPAVYLSRLGWILHREGREEVAGALLDKAVANPPSDPKARRELGGVLAAAGKTQAAIKLFEGIELTDEDRLQLVALHAAAKQFKLAIEQAETLVREKPDDALAQRWLADVSLWGSQYAKALELYTRLLETDFDQPLSWLGFVEAANKAGRVTNEQAKLALLIADDPATARSKDGVFLARLGLILHRDAEHRENFTRLAVAALANSCATGIWNPTAGIVVLRGSQTRARALIERALRDRPRDATELARLAWAVHQAGYETQAVAVLDEALALRPPEPAVRRELGDVLVATGRLRQALTWFEELAASNPNDAEIQTRLAEVTVWAGDYSKGLERVEKLLATNIDQPVLWQPFADAAAGVTKMSETQLNLLRNIVKQEVPSTWDSRARALYYSRLAWALVRESEHAKTDELALLARPLLDAAQKLPLTDFTARRELAGVLAAAKRFKEAIAILDQLELESPGDPELRRTTAKLLLADGQPALALTRMESLLGADFARQDLWRAFAVAAVQVERLNVAQLGMLERIAEQTPTDIADRAVHLARLGQALLRHGNEPKSPELIARAHSLIDNALAKLPESPIERRELAGILAAASRPKQALEAVRGLDLSDAPGRSLLADLYAAEGDMDAAEREARELVRLVPNDWEAKLKLANVLGWGKKYVEAIQSYRVLGRERPDNPEVPLRLAQMSLWSTKYDDALDQFQKLIDGGDRRQETRSGFIDAAGQAKSLDVALHRKTALAVIDLISTENMSPELLGKAAWMLSRLRESGRAAELLTQMLAAEPTSREVRKRLAEALTEAGQLQEAEKHFRYLLRTSPDR